ncbi:MAG TPA: hypothetical protein VHB27_02765 [Rhodopila sp.]|uniref:hypothetical protein n=1 Tax=Rhodopila sp. TaxID=2480087 RepID=UPI002BC618FD|nr:hypothetical protein [Rhodopila sp.]HVY14124.1 hypothetical protein [Rhodopila sp.]
MSQYTPPVCHLSHPGFRMFGDPVFRLSEGAAVPSMVIKLDGQTAVLPLRSLAREFGLAEDSPDGQMLRQIEQALDYVVAIKIGDTLPPELGGVASWEPTDHDRRVASSLMWHSLVRCVFARMGREYSIQGGAKPGWETDPANQGLAREAIDGAMHILGFKDESEARSKLAEIIAQLAYIEALRRMLNRGIAWVTEKLIHRSAHDVAPTRAETLKQVRILARRGIEEINRRFDEVDAAMDDVLGMMEDAEVAVADLKRRRDWLYRTNRAWTPMFTDWANAPNHVDEFLWKIVERSYQFLAPRYMPYKEWSLSLTGFKTSAPQMQVW